MANVVITGANRGIGLALTKHYLSRGDQVWALCRSASDELKDTQANIVEGVDVQDFNSLPKALAPLSQINIDILINNAGIFRNESLGDINVDSIEQQFKVNALAPLVITDLLVNNMNSGSKLALITSRMGSISDNGSGAYYGYRMSKAALNAAGMSLTQDLRSKEIAVAILHPGFVQTEMVNFNGDISADDSAANLVKRIDALTMQNSGTFWHSNGQELPW
ncbi:SDR family oxidoreductase [Paraneptunicella aestuarii]|uniref:SDR family oxidoreductase n=1 Tax=Paraneptunicella aestuarii TaxID=2831148 RepID=UPI001E5070F1|nr:SDR family oxidoreductase [Paraneptunicella aestuarii]UAA40524.1 SDR family oxidoreductase [Paraneptunicella aestuarii]